MEAAFIQRETGDTNWRNGMLRVGELFEWLSHPQLNPDILPIRLLAAAVYELAGYPARAAGLLNEDIFRHILLRQKGKMKELKRGYALIFSGQLCT
ncbi:hypothetical protein [Nostoc flagelliforme]|nr:hypothetical protein [Nostoc flagelliforme]